MYSLSMKKKTERGVPMGTLIVKVRDLNRRKRRNRKARRDKQRAKEEAEEKLFNGETSIEDIGSSRSRRWKGGGKGRSEVRPESGPKLDRESSPSESRSGGVSVREASREGGHRKLIMDYGHIGQR